MFSISNLKRDFTTNFARLDAAAEDPELRPLSLSIPPAAVGDKIVSWASDQSHWAVVSREADGERIQIHLTRTTRILRFVDDIRVTLVPDGETTRVEAESQSRIGKGDLGQNPRNLKELTRILLSKDSA